MNNRDLLRIINTMKSRKTLAALGFLLAPVMLVVYAWFFGVLFILIGLIPIKAGEYMIAVLLIMGGILLLPPIKNRLSSKFPFFKAGVASTLGVVLVLSGFVSIGMLDEVVASVHAKQNGGVMVSSPYEKPVTIAKDAAPSMTANQAVVITEIPKMPKPASQRPPEPLKRSMPVPATPSAALGQSCDNLPKTCGAMQSCNQAKEALACGNTRLDGDGDGIPCNAICK